MAPAQESSHPGRRVGQMLEGQHPLVRSTVVQDADRPALLNGPVGYNAALVPATGPCHQRMEERAELGAPKRAELGVSTFAVMAAGWDQKDIDRCLVLAQYKGRGFTNDEELSWLHLPPEWYDTVEQSGAHTHTYGG